MYYSKNSVCLNSHWEDSSRRGAATSRGQTGAEQKEPPPPPWHLSW